MVTEFILPDVGEGIVECEIVEWLVKEGDVIAEDQPVADVQTDKALIQIPSKYNGTVHKLHYAEGEVAKVHAPLFSMVVEEDAADGVTTAPVTENKADNTAAAATGNAPVEFILPDIGEGVVECELVEWLVKEGDVIAEDQPVADVQTDKALVQIPSMYNGVVAKLHYKEGDIAKVHAPLFSILVDGDSDAVAALAPVASAAQASAPAVAPVAAVVAPQVDSSKLSDEERRRIRTLASPAVRRIARENDLDIASVAGTGKQGRVLKEDVVNYLSGAPVAAPAAAATTSATSTTATPVTTAQPMVAGGTRTESITGIKAAMARQMMASVQNIPHFTYAEEIDMSALVAMRQRLKPEFERMGTKLSMMPFFIKALSLSLLDFEILNAQVNEAGDTLTYFADHNIGMAVDTPKGLFVPNIKQVQNKSLFEISEAVNELATLGRAGRLGPDHLKGGTITISNIGAIGGTVTTPIINRPEVAIVGLGRLQTLPRFDASGQVVAKQILNASWSGDHRVIDGGIIARFCNQWKLYLENPEMMLARLR